MPQNATSRAADLVITGCTALLHDPRGEVHFSEDTTIVVRDGVIDSVRAATDRLPLGAPADVAARDVAARGGADAAGWAAGGRSGAGDEADGGVAALRGVVSGLHGGGGVDGGVVPPGVGEHIDGRGLLALPGLINCHTHSPMVVLRGIAEDLPLHEWFNDWIWPIESRLTARDITLGARLACAEMIRGGVTCFADHYFAMDAIADVVAECGMRANLGQTYFSSQGVEGRAEALEFALARQGAAGGRITTSLGPHAPYTVTDADLAATAELAREHGLAVHLHAAENREQTEASVARHGHTPIEILGRTGLLDVDLLIAHATGLIERDYDALSTATGRVAVATAPRGYLKFAWDPPATPVRRLRELGIAVGLATDGAASAGTLDLWDTLGLHALVQKQFDGDPRWMTARQVLHHATLQSARAVGLAASVGSIAPGRRADIVLVDIGGPHTQPVHDIAATLVHSARASDVVTTVVDGRVLMRERRLLTLDVDETVAELEQRLPALTDRSHGQRIDEYREYRGSRESREHQDEQ